MTMYNAQHLSASNDYQVQETNWYEVVIADNPKLTYLTQSCTLPESSNNPIEVPFGNSVAKVAGRREFGQGNIVFMDAMKVDVEKTLLKWQNKIYNAKTGKMGWVEDYKKTASITEYGPDGTYRRSWTLLGAWPSSVNYGEMSSENADKKTISVTLEYDNAYRDDVD